MNDIRTVVARHTSLQKKGANWRGVCPLHDPEYSSEADPILGTLSVHVDSGRFYCFGCGASGDAAGFEEAMAQRQPTPLVAAGGMCAPAAPAYEIFDRVVRLIPSTLIELASLWRSDVRSLESRLLEIPYSKKKKIDRLQREIYEREMAIIFLEGGEGPDALMDYLNSVKSLLQSIISNGTKVKSTKALLTVVSSLLLDLEVFQKGGGYIESSPISSNLPTIVAPRGGITFQPPRLGDVDALSDAYDQWASSTPDNMAAHRNLGSAVAKFLSRER